VEYLGTYAWTMLALLVVLGTLYTFGVFNPSKMTPERCNSGSQIICIDTFLGVNDTDTQLLFQFKNNYPRSITVRNLTVDWDGTPVVSHLDLVVPPGRKFTVNTTLPIGISVGRNADLSYIITYQRYDISEVTMRHDITGTAVIHVQELKDTPESYCGDGIQDASEGCERPSMIYVGPLLGQDGWGGLGALPNTCPALDLGCASDCTCFHLPLTV
jgi:hypothetical protein